MYDFHLFGRHPEYLHQVFFGAFGYGDDFVGLVGQAPLAL
jgi:hypothetical protein